MRGVSNKIVRINEYIVVEIFMDNTIDGQYTIGCLVIEVYIIDNLKVNLLISNNILKP